MEDRVKLALRISHSLLDTEITNTIAAAKAEMRRAGVDNNVIDEDDEVFAQAILAYCLYVLAGDQKMKDGYFESWQYQLDNIRKTYPAERSEG